MAKKAELYLPLLLQPYQGARLRLDRIRSEGGLHTAGEEERGEHQALPTISLLLRYPQPGGQSMPAHTNHH